MRINLLVFSVELGGSELHTVRLACLLSARKHRVTIIEHGLHRYSQNIDLFGPARIEVLSCPWNLSVPFWSYREFLKNHGADLGFLVKSVFTVGGAKTDLAAWLSHRRFITIEHSLADPLPSRPVDKIVRRTRSAIRSHFPNRIICVSDAIRRRLEDQEGYPDSKMVTVHHGVDTVEFSPNEKMRQEMRRRWGLSKSAVVFGYVGRLSPEKGVATAISAFAHLYASGLARDPWLVLVGEGRERPALESLAEAKNVRERVLFVGFLKKPQEVYPSFDYLLLPSVREGFGLALLEGMACGCPGIAMNVGGIPEIVSDPRLGWLVPGGDGAAFAEAMIQAAQLSLQDRAQMGQTAREHAVSKFDLNTSLDSLIKIIEE